jgi:hypothetical protein
MINYYYELKPGTKVLGKEVQYLAKFNWHPGQAMSFEYKMHDDAMENSKRVWLENANGVSLIKGPVDEVSWDLVNEQELVWLKLICRDIEAL